MQTMFLSWIKQTSISLVKLWWMRIAIKVKTIAVTYRSCTLSMHESVILIRKQIMYECMLRTDHTLYLCTDTFQYIHVVFTQIQDNVWICHVYVAVCFSIYAGQGSWFRFLWHLHVVLFSIKLDLSKNVNKLFAVAQYYTVWIFKCFLLWFFFYGCYGVHKWMNYMDSYHLVIWCPFGVCKCPFLKKKTPPKFTLKKAEKIQFCKNHNSIWWFTLLDIGNNSKMDVLNKINGVCLIAR